MKLVIAVWLILDYACITLHPICLIGSILTLLMCHDMFIL
jgi:hypothetical protein